MLNREVEIISGLWPIFGIKHGGVSRFDIAADAGQEGLRQRLGGNRQRSNQAVGPNSEDIGWGYRSHRITGGVETAVCASPNSLRATNCLENSRAKQGNQHLIHAVYAAVQTSVAGSEHRLAVSDQLAQESGSVAGIPGYRDTRTEAAFERLIRIVQLEAPGRFKANNGIVNLSVERRGLALSEVICRVD